MDLLAEFGKHPPQTYADGTGLSYIYPAGSGLLTRRDWARKRGGLPLYTYYTYNLQGELTAIRDENNVPRVEYTRDDEGRLRTVKDAAGTRTLGYVYDGAGALTVTKSTAAEGGYLGATTMTRTFDAAGRPTGYSFADGLAGSQPIAATYGYDAGTGQLTAIHRGAEQIASYGYDADTGWLRTMANITRFPDAQGRVQRIIRTGDNPAQPTFSVAYTFDAKGRRERVTREDGSYWQYGYNRRNEVISGVKYHADGTPVPGYHFTYAYDAIGNRTASTAGAALTPEMPESHKSSYTANSLNQYSARTIPGQAGVRDRSPRRGRATPWR